MEQKLYLILALKCLILVDNVIKQSFRDWKEDYAEAEWQWYLSGDPHVNTLGKIYGKVPKIWTKMANKLGLVNSNYGAQWEEKSIRQSC
jgi:hypothetical protein